MKSVLGLVVACAALLLSGCAVDGADVTPPNDTAAATPGADEAAVAAGDCVNAAAGAGIASAEVVPCSESHDQEAFYLFELSGGEYPGDDPIWIAAEQNCGAQFEMFVGVPYTESALDWFYLSPTPQSWLEGDRTVVCTVYDPAGPASGTLAGSVR